LHLEKTIPALSKGINIKLSTLILCIVLISFSDVSFAQERERKTPRREVVKPQGEKPKSNRKELRETKFKTRNKRGDKSYKGDITGRKVQRKRSPRPKDDYSKPKPYAGRKMNRKNVDSKNTFKSPRIRTTSRKGERTRKGDISGRKIRSTTTRPRQITPSYTQTNPKLLSSTSNDGKRRIRSINKNYQSNRNRARNSSVTSQVGQRRTKASSKSRIPPSNTKRGELSGKNISGGYSSVSGTIRNRKPHNPYAVANTNKKRRGDKSFKGDITGRKVRKKISPRQRVTITPPNPYYGRPKTTVFKSSKKSRNNVRTDTKSVKRNSQYKASVIRSASPKGERYTDKGIGGNPIFTKNFRSTTPTFTGGPRYEAPRSRRRGEQSWSNKGELKEVKRRSSRKKTEVAYGQIGGFQTATRPGESYTNKDIAGRKLRTRNYESYRQQITQPTFNPYYFRKAKGDQITVKGQKIRRNLTSGTKVNNNDGNPLPPRFISSGVGIFQGGTKAKKPITGGGSVGFRLRNNQGVPLSPFVPGDLGMGNYQGGMKSDKPLTGGGSVSFRLRNNQGVPLSPFVPGDLGMGSYQGGMKPIKAPKGGGSVGYKLRNNKGVSLSIMNAGIGTIRGAGYKGNIKTYEYTKRPVLGSAKFRLHNNNFKPMGTYKPGQGAIKGSNYTGNTKIPKGYKMDAGPEIRQNRTLKQYIPGQLRLDRYSGNVKIYKGYRMDAGPDIKKNRTLKQYIPGQLRLDRYSGNYSTKRYSRKNLHPSAAYTKRTGESSTKEKQKIFKFKLWVNSIFRNERPASEKEKIRKPRYDKGESEIWFD